MNNYQILFEDEWLIVVNKPSGILIIPVIKNGKNTLTDLLNRELDSRGIKINAYPAHRLDRETSGVIIYAKGKNAQAKMMDEFKMRRVKKTYIAVVEGHVRNDSGAIGQSILNRNKRYEPARTNYKVLKREKGYTVLEVEPVTGRTNQIRIHMKYIGHPILGERIYAFRKDFKTDFKRLALHAYKIEFMHPFTKKMMAFVAEVPGDMRELIG